MTILTYNPRAYIGSGPSYCCAAISAGLDRRCRDHRTTFLRAKLAPPCRVTRPVATRLTNHALFHLDRAGLVGRMEARFVREAVTSAEATAVPTVAILWPGASLDLVRRLRAAGVVVAFQMINTALGSAKPILDTAYTALGVANPNAVSDEAIAGERALLAAVDFVLSPSRPVTASLRQVGVAEANILPAPFGWDAARFPPCPSRAPGFRVLFVGSVCVRKGAHLLLRAWAASGIRGELVLCGKVEPAIRQTCGDLLTRPDVRLVPFTRRIAKIYRAADVFAFPTLEEGAPLVTYEAVGVGLPVVTTAMGACGIVRDGVNGVVLDAYDLAGWVAALQQLAASPELRQRFGAASRAIGATCTWDQAAAIRDDALSPGRFVGDRLAS